MGKRKYTMSNSGPHSGTGIEHTYQDGETQFKKLEPNSV